MPCEGHLGGMEITIQHIGSEGYFSWHTGVRFGRNFNRHDFADIQGLGWVKKRWVWYTFSTKYGVGFGYMISCSPTEAFNIAGHIDAGTLFFFGGGRGERGRLWPVNGGLDIDGSTLQELAQDNLLGNGKALESRTKGLKSSRRGAYICSQLCFIRIELGLACFI